MALNRFSFPSVDMWAILYFDFGIRFKHTPYSKMAAILAFFCFDLALAKQKVLVDNASNQLSNQFIQRNESAFHPLIK